MLQNVPMAETTRKFFSLAVIAAFLFVGFGEQAHAVVLCFGADGHSGLEREVGDRCAPRASGLCLKTGEVPNEGETTIEEGAPDPCLDYCIFSTAESIRKQRHAPDFSPPFSGNVAAAALRPRELLSPRLSPSAIPPPYQTAIALRSIVLLI